MTCFCYVESPVIAAGDYFIVFREVKNGEKTQNRNSEKREAVGKKP